MEKNRQVSGTKSCIALIGILYFLLLQSTLFCHGQSLESQSGTQDTLAFKCITGEYPSSIKNTIDIMTPSSYIDSRTVKNVPVQFHVVRQSNGTGGLTAAQVTAELTKLNTHFQNGNIHFFECSPMRYINSDTYYNLETF